MLEIEEIRSLIREKSQQTSSGKNRPIERITTVGGLYRDGAFTGGNDSSVFFVSVSYLLKTGFSISPDFRLTNYNLDPAFGGKDFLDPVNSAPADLVFFLAVFDPSKESDVLRFSSRERNSEVCVSPLHSHRAFREAVGRTGAGLSLFNAFGPGEIDEAIFPSDGFSGSDWRVAIGTEERFRLRDAFNRGSTVPFSIALKRDLLDELSASGAMSCADGKYRTILHQRLAEYTPD